MAYSRWRNENMNTLQRQQMLEAVKAFKCFTTENDLNNYISPTIGKKCLNLMRRMKSARLKKNCMTISEILSIKREMSDILVTDLFDDTEPVKKVEEEEINLEANKYLDEANSNDDSSDDSLYSDEKGVLKNQLFKGLFGKDNKDSENIMENLGKVTGNLMETMINPLLSNAMQIAKPYIKTMILALDTLKEDLSLSAQQRQFYETAYNYYLELDEIYSRKISAIEQAMLTEEIGRRYDKDRIERILKEDPKTTEIMSSMINDSSATGEKMLENIESLGDQCKVS